MKPVAILGLGPAGLMAAHAVALAGKPVALFSKPADEGGSIRRSKLGGAQFLHDPMPLINDDDPDTVITYRVVGNTDVYRRKVYGDTAVPFVSMENVHDRQEQPAWNLQATYDKLWDWYGVDRVGNPDVITPAWIDNALEQDWFSLILSAMPAPALCRTINDPFHVMNTAPHSFLTQQVTIADEAMMPHDNTIWYDGTMDHSWYRSSVLFGYGSTEWGGGRRSVFPNTVDVHKPLRTNCDCFADSVIRLGRFGTWTKGVLTHHAFAAAVKAVQ